MNLVQDLIDDRYFRRRAVVPLRVPEKFINAALEEHRKIEALVDNSRRSLCVVCVIILICVVYSYFSR